MSYDANGNILSLRRNSYDIKAKKTVNLDDLVYGYSGNQLKRVEDAGSSSGFKNGASVNAEYLYDANGNMTRDLNKGIQNIKYNELNLPESISFADGRKISYIYSAAGEKLQNIVGGKTISYCGGFVYEDKKLAYILNSEGRYVVNGSDGVYEYNICDHLGNVRAVVDGVGTVKQKSNYYPFGGVFAQAGKSDNKYLYNGKEKQEGTDWLDYGKRMYDPFTVRFLTHDPLVESYYSYSPYNYVGGNPIIRIDKNGEFWLQIGGAILGAAVDYAGQVSANMICGNSFSEALTNNISIGSILVSAGEGALTSGASVLKTSGKTGIKMILKTALKEGGKGAASQLIDNSIKIATGKKTSLLEGVADKSITSAIVGAAVDVKGFKKTDFGNLEKNIKKLSSKTKATLKQRRILKASKQKLHSSKLNNTVKSTGNASTSNTVANIKTKLENK